jgi:hypothetical protein
MLMPEQIPDAVIEAAIEEYEAAAFARLSTRDSFAVMIAAAINCWPSEQCGVGASRAEIVLRISGQEAGARPGS